MFSLLLFPCKHAALWAHRWESWDYQSSFCNLWRSACQVSSSEWNSSFWRAVVEGTRGDGHLLLPSPPLCCCQRRTEHARWAGLTPLSPHRCTHTHTSTVIKIHSTCNKRGNMQYLWFRSSPVELHPWWWEPPVGPVFHTLLSLPHGSLYKHWCRHTWDTITKKKASGKALLQDSVIVGH